ncbi:MAG: gliding motility-associated C-terminal domain-containing protein [Bacteroidetes bacterium]|nr:gliding motility-associated C-terminal domain-containing protein [Bacteroidota bacterium]
MKKLLKSTSALCVFFISNLCYTQNLVSNGDFETYYSCPDWYNQVDSAKGWFKSSTKNNPSYHTEYLNACSPSNLFKVPTNTWGYQVAASGQAYMAQVTMAPTVQKDYRENIYTKLTSPLTIGSTYYVSMKVSRTDNTQHASNNLGVQLSVNSSFPLSNRSQVYSGTIITDTTKWTTISGSFIADSAYQYIAIGNFFTDSATSSSVACGSCQFIQYGYFIDDVSVVACNASVTLNSSTTSICSGESVTLTATGGKIYNWNTGATDSVLIVSPTSTTTYTVTSSNSLCTSLPKTITITVKPSPTINITGNTLICQGQSTTLSVSGGKTYSWSDGSIDSVLIISPSSTTTYTVSTSNSICTSTPKTITVNVTPAPTVNINCVAQNLVSNPSFEQYTQCPFDYNQADFAKDWLKSSNNNNPTYHTEYLNTCSPSSLFQVPTSTWGYQVASSGQAYMAQVTLAPSVQKDYRENIYTKLIAPLIKGNTYYVSLRASHADNCQNASNNLGVKFSSNSNLLINNISPVYSNSIITDNTKWITILGSFIADSTYQYLGIGNFFTDSATSKLNSCPGCSFVQYGYLIDDISVTGCSGIDAVTICSGQSATLSVSGGKTYSWSNGSNDSILIVSPVSSTTYTITTSNGSCTSSTKTITVNIVSPPTANITGNTTICQGQSTTLTVSGGKTYSWSNGSSDSVLVVSPGSTTTYTVTTNNGSCTSATKTITVNVTPAPTANITGNTSICQGQSTTLTAGGGGTYQWSGGISSTSASVTVSPSSSTTYSVTVNSGGCFSLPAAVTVNVLMPPTATITGNTAVCQGQSTTLTAGGGTSYQWSGGITSASASIIVSPSSSTTYFLTANNGSCSSPPASVTVTVTPLPIAGISGNTTICQGQSTTLTAGGGISYQWSGGISSASSSITVSPSTSTTYYVTTNDGTCTSSPASVTVIVTPIPTAGITGVTTICSGQSTTLTASGGGNYQWYGGISSTSSSVTVSPSTITTYSVVVNDGSCFSLPFSVTVQVLPVPNTTVAGDTILCPGESRTLTANGGSIYNWSSTSSVVSSITVSPTATTTYTVIAGNGTCYGTSAIITVHVMPTPTASASPATSLIDHGASVNIIASGGGTYTWTPAKGLSCTNCSNPTATPDTSTIYTVTITDANGCTATTMVSILIKAFCNGNEKDIFIANVFSPNNDGKNDVLKAQGNGLKDVYWAIFDRWGNKVFETADLSKTWDGTYRGEMVVAGTYFYILTATCIQSNSEINLKGNVTVIR